MLGESATDSVSILVGAMSGGEYYGTILLRTLDDCAGAREGIIIEEEE